MAASPRVLVHDLFQQLRWRRFPLGVPDLAALRDSLTAGFGWSSREAFRELIVALWAKSTREADVIRALFARLPWPEDWVALQMSHTLAAPPGAVAQPTLSPMAGGVPAEADGGLAPATPAPVTQRLGSMPPLTLSQVDASDARLIFVEQYPLNSREVAQALRRLRRPLRIGPPVELDVAATIARRARAGTSVPPVLVPARRNTSRLLMLVDVAGSMVPYRPFVNLFVESVLEAGWLQQVSLFYFHDTPAVAADRSVLLDLEAPGLHPRLDPVLAQIEPVVAGDVFTDEAMTQPAQLRDTYHALPADTVAFIVSDAAAARSSIDTVRLLDNIAFLKGLKTRVRAFAWLNPVPRELWARSNAAQLARHVPMFPLDRRGLEQAVNVLRGQPLPLERPL